VSLFLLAVIVVVCSAVLLHQWYVGAVLPPLDKARREARRSHRTWR
jgi:hypothetical protein